MIQFRHPAADSRLDVPASMTKCRGPALRCPRCKLVIAPRIPTIAPRHCPRCLAFSRIVVQLAMLPPQRLGESLPPAPA